MKTQDDIDKIARSTRDAGVSDSLNRWLGMTPELLAESENKVRRQITADRNQRRTEMPKLGAKEQALQGLREQKAEKAVPVPKKTATAKRPKEDVAAKKTAQTKARTPVQDKDTPSVGRPAEKQVIIQKLLAKKNGCTAKEVMEACNWPSVSMPQQATALGVTLHKKKPEGESTRYADHPLD